MESLEEINNTLEEDTSHTTLVDDLASYSADGINGLGGLLEENFK